MTVPGQPQFELFLPKNTLAQAQLGNAYWFGHHVAVDAAEADAVVQQRR